MTPCLGWGGGHITQNAVQMRTSLQLSSVLGRINNSSVKQYLGRKSAFLSSYEDILWQPFFKTKIVTLMVDG